MGIDMWLHRRCVSNLHFKLLRLKGIGVEENVLQTQTRPMNELWPNSFQGLGRDVTKVTFRRMQVEVCVSFTPTTGAVDTGRLSRRFKIVGHGQGVDLPPALS